MSGIDISRAEKQAIAADVRQRSQWAEPLDQARARLARLDDQTVVLEAHLVDVRAQLTTAAYGERSALREEIAELEQEIRSLRASRPALEQSISQLDHRLQLEIGSGITAARRALEHARERY